MFFNEPEGNTLEQLLEFLGSAAALGTAITLRNKANKEITAYLYYSQEGLPKYLELFHPKEPIGEDRFRFLVKTMTWFKLRRYGRSPGTLDENGIPIAVMPIIAITAKELVLNGKIINSGVTAIHADSVKGKGKILAYEEEK